MDASAALGKLVGELADLLWKYLYDSFVIIPLVFASYMHVRISTLLRKEIDSSSMNDMFRSFVLPPDVVAFCVFDPRPVHACHDDR